MKPRLIRHIRGNLVGYLALFFALSSGSAWAVSGPLAARNTVNAAAIIDGQVKRADLGVGAVTSAKVANGTLKAADFARGTLARGPEGPPGPRGPAGPAGGAGTTTGPAGGDLSGNYPNPLVGQNAIGSTEVLDNSLTAADLAPGSVGSSEVADNALTGADVNESTLAQVPSALLGGLGRGASKTGFPNFCDPESPAFGTCVDVTVDLPARTRVLVIGSLSASAETGATDGEGTCRLETSVTGGLADTKTGIAVAAGVNRDHVTMVGVTPPLGPGRISFGIECNQAHTGGPYQILYQEAAIAAVAISPS